MNSPLILKAKSFAWLGDLAVVAAVIAGAAFLVRELCTPHPLAKPPPARTHSSAVPEDVRVVAKAVDAAFETDWAAKGLTSAPLAPSLTIARRLSLALTGSIPSLQEIRALEAVPEAERGAWWLAHLLEDRRYSDYMAERLARAYVGIEKGPFLVYRRRRLVDWLSDELHQNHRYDGIVRALIDTKGVWTTRPEVNFLTVTIEPKKGPDEAKLAARISRAFLGVRIDCVQCHDGKLGSSWKQKDFHQLAAYFGQAEASFTGLRDNPKKDYEYRYLGKMTPETVTPAVPWDPELLPQNGGLRDRLAAWVTAPENRPFARAMVNRMWGLIFNRSLVEPVDDIPLHGPFAPGLEILADDFIAHQFDLQRLIRVIASTRNFQMDSRSPDSTETASEAAEKQWAIFPMTRLRPEQMAGSVIQASALTTQDADTNVIFRLRRSIDESNFVKRYGDVGEDELGNQTGTIPQRLLLMNGELVRNHTGNNPLLNASTRIATLAPDDVSAVETAYLAAFTRRPTAEESTYFCAKLSEAKRSTRSAAMAELFWTLLNSTEFSWNH